MADAARIAGRPGRAPGERLRRQRGRSTPEDRLFGQANSRTCAPPYDPGLQPGGRQRPSLEKDPNTSDASRSSILYVLNENGGARVAAISDHLESHTQGVELP